MHLMCIKANEMKNKKFTSYADMMKRKKQRNCRLQCIDFTKSTRPMDEYTSAWDAVGMLAVVLVCRCRTHICHINLASEIGEQTFSCHLPPIAVSSTHRYRCLKPWEIYQNTFGGTLCHLSMDTIIAVVVLPLIVCTRHLQSLLMTCSKRNHYNFYERNMCNCALCTSEQVYNAKSIIRALVLVLVSNCVPLKSVLQHTLSNKIQCLNIVLDFVINLQIVGTERVCVGLRNANVQRTGCQMLDCVRGARLIRIQICRRNR